MFWERKNKVLLRLKKQNEEIARLKKECAIRNTTGMVITRELILYTRIARLQKQLLSEIMKTHKKIQKNKKASYKERYNKLNNLLNKINITLTTNEQLKKIGGEVHAPSV